MSRLKLFIPLLVFIFLGGFFWVGLSLDPTAMPSALIDKPMPSFSLPTLENPDEEVTEAVVKGQVSLVNVWGTWCVACRQEHPFLNQLKAQGVPIYGINYKDDTEAAKQWLRDLHNPYLLNIVDEEGRLGIDLGVFGAPETYVLDSRGVIRYKHVGIINDKVWRETIGPLMKSLD